MLASHKMDREKHNRIRERSDKISSLMGQYLLRGYRMLGSCCEKCDTVLLKFRDEPEYCIGCQEVDVKINGVQQASQPAVESHEASNVSQMQPVERACTSKEEDHRETIHTTDIPMQSELITTAISSLNDKILWASNGLKNCISIEESIRYCELLKSCAGAIKALRDTETI